LSPALKVLVGTLLGLIIGIVLLSIFNCFLSCFGKGSYKDNLKAYSAQYTSLPQDEKVVQKVRLFFFKKKNFISYFSYPISNEK